MWSRYEIGNFVRPDFSHITAVGDGPVSMHETIAVLILGDPVIKPLFDSGTAYTAAAYRVP